MTTYFLCNHSLIISNFIFGSHDKIITSQKTGFFCKLPGGVFPNGKVLLWWEDVFSWKSLGKLFDSWVGLPKPKQNKMDYPQDT